MDASRRLFNCIFPANAKFHFANFPIFDTASFLCSAIIRDSSRSLPQREKVIEAIGLAFSLMEQLSGLTKSGAICYTILGRLMAKLSLSPEERPILHALPLEFSSIGSEPSKIHPDVGSGHRRKTPTHSVSSTYETFLAIPDSSDSLDWATPGVEAAQI
jgi:hypothetical protein